jgi:predicted O-linked N-acetylglucosamine transferase (SPINDLY family)
MISVRQALDAAWQHYRRGEWPQAEQLYLRVLAVDPDQVDALHQLAAIAGQTGREDRAIDYLRTVLRIRPGWAAAHNNLGNVYAAQGKLAEAVASFQEAVRLQPDFVMAHNNLGIALRQQGRPAEAVASLQQALRIRPDYAEAHQNLGLAWLALGKLPQAQTSLQQALRNRPDDAELHYYLGNALLPQGKAAEAADHFQQALRLKGDYAEALHSLGIAFQEQGKLAEAMASLQQTLRLKPDFAEAHVNLGNVLVQQGQLAQAVASYQEALRLRPDFAPALSNLGNLQRELGQLVEAEASLRQALRLKPDYAEAHYNLGIVLWRQRRLAEAVASYQEALRYKPDYAEAHLDLGNARKDQGRLDDAIAAFRTALRIKPEAAPIDSNLVLTLNYHPRYDARAIQEECARWNRQHAEPLHRFLRPHINRPGPERRLRIGYVSPDFREHVDSFFTIPLLSNHDHRQCEIFCYADVASPDAITERLRGYADVWRSTAGLTDQQLAELVRSDQIDILVDLKMHTANNRLLVFARKPAPIQVAWLGYPGTTGLSTMDYRLTDPYLDPPGLFDAFYAEESVRLPDTFWCYDPRTDEPPVNALPAARNGFITFGCLNNFCKVNDDCLVLWAQVLRVVPQSRMLLLAPRGEAREHVSAKLEEEGIAPSRMEFVDKVPRPEYLRLYHRIDLGLDPLPYNGHTTSLDAFWMGVPTITLVSKQTAFGRAGWSQLCNLGLPELAAQTPEQYVTLAARLAGDLSRLQELRGTLRQRMQQSPLMDGQRFARHMEQAYRQMWHRWCQQPKPTEVREPSAPHQPLSGQGTETAEAYFNRGNALLQQGKLAEAAASYQEAMRLRPDSAEVPYNLGIVLLRQGRLEEAEASYRQALHLRPDHVGAHHNLGIVLKQQGRLADAAASFQQALRLEPSHADAQMNLGSVFRAQGLLDEATTAYRAALRFKLDFAEAQCNLGNVLKDQGLLDAAIAAYRASMQLKPDAAGLHSNLVFLLPFHPAYDAAAILEECRRWNQQHAEPLKRFIQPHSNPRDPERRLRIGYVSPDFRDHVQSYFTIPLLSHHDHRQCEIFCYANVLGSDAITERLRGCADAWRSTVGLSDQQVADLVRGDRIDILVDLTMHMAKNRLLVFAQRPAPIQVAWLAYPGTTGLSTMDYRLTDPYLDPPGLFDAFYAEESIRLPDTFWCYDPLTGKKGDCPLEEGGQSPFLPDEQPAVSGLPAFEKGVVTFGCLNNFCKINDGCLALWAKVLQAVPPSNLLLLAPRGRAREYVLARMTQEGISASRVEFADKQPRLEYLKLYHRMDLALDPVPYNGHTTSLDGFWMGVPTVTLVSTTTAFGRAGWSQLNNLGLQELAAQTPEQYIALAAELAGDLPRLGELRGTLRRRMRQSPLMDGKRFAGHMEQAYRQMWHRWCKGVQR